MKTVNVTVTIQLDINGSKNTLLEVYSAMDKINEILSRETSFDSDAQIFTNAIEESDITISSHGFEVGDEVQVPEPLTDDLYNHSFVGVIADFRGENAIVEDGDSNCYEIEIDRLTSV